MVPIWVVYVIKVYFGTYFVIVKIDTTCSLMWFNWKIMWSCNKDKVYGALCGRLESMALRAISYKWYKYMTIWLCVQLLWLTMWITILLVYVVEVALVPMMWK